MKSKDRNKKPHENIIGKIIYGFLLFMPLLAISVTCAYAIFNKNSYQSYSGLNENSQENIIINTTNNFDYAKTYYLNNSYLTEATTSGSTSNMNFNTFEIIQNNPSIVLPDDIIRCYIYVGNNSTQLTFYFTDSNNVVYTLTSNQTFNVKVTIRSFTGGTTREQILNDVLSKSNVLFYIDYNTNQQIDNVFYYSIDKVQQSPLFNWAENSAIYTGMNGTCNALNITTPFIPLLMTYWLIISVIYILYDIILVILHIFHKKIHQLEDSF